MSPTPISATLARHGAAASRFRLIRVTQRGTHHDLDEWTVEIRLTGISTDDSPHSDGIRMLAAGTVENSVYSLARQSQAASMEAFAGEVIDFLLNRDAQVTGAEVSIASHLWKRLTIEGQPYPTAFMKGSNERQTARVSRDRNGAATITSGFDEMTVLKTAPSGTDRLFVPAVTAEWSYTAQAIAEGIDFDKVRQRLRERIITTFAQHESLDMQQTLSAMAEAALQHTDVIDTVFLHVPNRHNGAVDLGRMGSDHPNRIFVPLNGPIDEPHGAIEATARRGQR